MIKYQEKTLKRKIEYLLYESRYSRRSRLVEKFIKPLVETGQVGLFGGAVRDALFKSARDFNSDLDFVIEVKNQKQFSKLLEKYSPQKNSYGGYRTIIGNTKIDFWQLKDSWVKNDSNLNVNNIKDLVDTTFFNLDAIIYDLNNRKIYKGNTFSDGIEKETLDINYAHNPNLDSVAVKAIRRLWTHDLRASDKLISFIVERINKSGWESLVERDKNAYPHFQILVTLSTKKSIKNEDFSILLKSSKEWNKVRQSVFPI